jgi:hypothetical protein
MCRARALRGRAGGRATLHGRATLREAPEGGLLAGLLAACFRGLEASTERTPAARRRRPADDGGAAAEAASAAEATPAQAEAAATAVLEAAREASARVAAAAAARRAAGDTQEHARATVESAVAQDGVHAARIKHNGILLKALVVGPAAGLGATGARLLCWEEPVATAAALGLLQWLA